MREFWAERSRGTEIHAWTDGVMSCTLALRLAGRERRRARSLSDTRVKKKKKKGRASEGPAGLPATIVSFFLDCSCRRGDVEQSSVGDRGRNVYSFSVDAQATSASRCRTQGFSLLVSADGGTSFFF